MTRSRLLFESRLEEIDRARAMVAAFRARNRLDARAELVLTLIVEELMTNTVNHGGVTAKDHIGLELEAAGDGISLRFDDAGTPFDPLHDLPPDERDSPLEQRRVGGLGWPMILGYCRQLEYRREHGRNHLQLLLDLGARTVPV